MTRPATTVEPTAGPDDARAALHRLRAEVAKAVVGQDAVVTGLVIALLCRGHVLLEGVPGVAKTLLVRTARRRARPGHQAGAVHPRPDARRRHRLAGLRRAHRRVHRSGRGRSSPTCCSPTRSTGRRRRPRPRCWRRWRSGRCRSRAARRPLPDPFIVAATQNPIEYEGTYPLPEAQLDRFLLKLTVPLPTRDEELGVLRAHHAGFDPRDLGRGRRPAGGRRRRPGRRPGRGPAGCRSPTAVLALHRGPVPGHPGRRRRWSWAPRRAARPRCSARRRRGPGCPAATTSPPTTSRPSPGRRCGTGCGCAPRPSWRASPPTPCWTPCSPPCRPRGDAGHRAVPALLLGARACAALRAAGRTVGRGWPLLAGAGCSRCSSVSTWRSPAPPREITARAAPVTGRSGWASRRPSTLRRDTTTGAAVRCGPGPRRLGAVGRAPRRTYHDRSTSDPARRGALETTLTPTRRGDRPAVRVTVRSLRAARAGVPAARQRAATGHPGWTLRVLPAFDVPAVPAGEAGPAARHRRLAGRPGGAGQGTEFDSLREYVVGDDVRSIDWRASARASRRRWSAPGGRSGTGGVVCVLDTGRTVGRSRGRRRAPAGRRHRRRAAARRAGRPGRRPGRPARRRHRGPGHGHRRRPSRRCCPGWSSALAPLQPALVETDFGAGRRARCCGGERKRAWWCCSPRWSRARSARACCRCCPGWPPGTRVIVAAVHDPALDRADRPPPRGTPRGRLRRAAAAERALAERDRVRGRAAPVRGRRGGRPGGPFAPARGRRLPGASRPPASSEPGRSARAVGGGARRGPGRWRRRVRPARGRRARPVRARRRPPGDRAAPRTPGNASHTVAPMPTRSATGSGDGVTNASSSRGRPRRAPTRPSATSDRRPARLARATGPGSQRARR